VVGDDLSPGSPSRSSVKHSTALRSPHRALRIGVLALQGDFAKHAEVLERLGVRSVPIRLPNQMEQVDGLIIPGGESTTLGKLMSRFGLDEAILRCAREGMPIFGTCAGMIVLAKEIEGSDQPKLGLMNITVRRNAFGRQVNSFETDLDVPEIGQGPVRAVFIRAPFVTEVKNSAKVLAALDEGTVVLVREGNCLAAAFHPELTDDTRVHTYFLQMCSEAARSTGGPGENTGDFR